MKGIVYTLLLTVIAATEASAQLRDIFNRVDPNKVRQGVKAVTAARDFSEDAEVEIGRIVAARVLASYPLSKDERLQKYVTLVGHTVANYSSRPQLSWHFAVIEAPIVNAFSTPGGYIFLTTGAIGQMRSESELAAVLGHEIAHATEKHILNEVRRANLFAAGLDIAGSEFGRGGITDELAKKVSQIANDKLFKTGLGRRDELEADRIGVRLAASAGYRADSMLTFLGTLDALHTEKSGAMALLAATHPKPSDRMEALKKLKLGGSGVELRERFAAWSAR